MILKCVSESVIRPKFRTVSESHARQQAFQKARIRDKHMAVRLVCTDCHIWCTYVFSQDNLKCFKCLPFHRFLTCHPETWLNCSFWCVLSCDRFQSTVSSAKIIYANLFLHSIQILPQLVISFFFFQLEIHSFTRIQGKYMIGSFLGGSRNLWNRASWLAVA